MHRVMRTEGEGEISQKNERKKDFRNVAVTTKRKRKKREENNSQQIYKQNELNEMRSITFVVEERKKVDGRRRGRFLT